MNRPVGIWRSIHGYGAAQLVNGRLLLCGYDVSLHLWRDAKYDGILEANGIPFRLEIKSTGINRDPFSHRDAELTFTSGGRSGEQHNRKAKSREKTISTVDADFAFGVSSHDATLWVVPVELLPIIGRKLKVAYSEIFKEKVGIFKGVSKTLNSKQIQNGFVNLKISELEKLCNTNNISISNSRKLKSYDYGWRTSIRKTTISCNYKTSLVLDLWRYVYEKS